MPSSWRGVHLLPCPPLTQAVAPLPLLGVLCDHHRAGAALPQPRIVDQVHQQLVVGGVQGVELGRSLAFCPHDDKMELQLHNNIILSFLLKVLEI